MKEDLHQEPEVQEPGLRRAVMVKILELTMAAFSLVAALAWNDAIQTIFTTFFGPANSAVAKLIYAILVTGIVVWVGLRLSRLNKKYSIQK